MLFRSTLAEAQPVDIWRWTNGRALIAAGSPFADIQEGNQSYRVAQSNNAFVFPGVGLGVIAAKARHVTTRMLFKATEALSACAPILQQSNAPLLPKLSDAKQVSAQIALAVATEARQEGLSMMPLDTDFKPAIDHLLWEPRYYVYRKV